MNFEKARKCYKYFFSCFLLNLSQNKRVHKSDSCMRLIKYRSDFTDIKMNKNALKLDDFSTPNQNPTP